MRHRLSISITAVCLLAAAHAAPAQTTKSAGADVHKLTIHPMAVAGRPMQYRLIPPKEDFTAGNAATLYMAAMLRIPYQPADWLDKVERLGALPTDQLPRDEVRALLKDAQPMLNLLRIASRRDHCEWEMARREDGALALLPHLHRMRPFMRLLSLQTRTALLEGRYADAADSMQTSVQMIRYCPGGDGILLDGLVAAKMGEIFTGDVEAWMSREGAPNLYWPIANAGRPMLDIQEIIRRERGYFYFAFPVLRNPRTISDAQWQEIVMDMLRDLNPDPPTKEELEKLQQRIAQIDASLLPKAKALPGMEGATDAQAMATYAVAEMERWRDEREKWFGLPFWQGYPGLRATDRAIREAQAKEPNPLVSMEPNTAVWYLRLVQPDRMSAALQTIEAVRAHGKVPEKLADLPLPLPIDPATGQPFAYERRGDDGFILISKIASGEPADELRYEVTLK
jgi:hypothetical protein